jgi:uncharacterized membrane protein HdeD (DUF308 family)
MAIVLDLFRNWWVLLIRGILAVTFGILALSRPAVTLAAIVMLLGAYYLVDGIFSIITSLTAPRGYRGWVSMLISGIAGVVIGLITFFMPRVTAVVLLYFVIAWLMVTGVMQIIAGIRLRKKLHGEFFLIAGGILSVLFGFYLLVNPGVGALAVMWLIGVYAITFGVIMIVAALRLRSWRGAKDERVGTADDVKAA